MSIDGSINVQNETWNKSNSFIKHALHNSKINHQNKNINFDDTHFNMFYTLDDNGNELISNVTDNSTILVNEQMLRESINESYQDWTEEHDQRMKHDNSKIGVDHLYDHMVYDNKKSKGFVSSFDVTFANGEKWDTIQEWFNDNISNDYEKLQQSVSQGLIQYVQDFNARYESLTCLQAVTNVDENKNVTGAPHVHMQVVKHSYTKAGSPSNNLNNCLKNEFNVKNNQKALSMFNDTESQHVRESVLESIRETFPNFTPEREKELEKYVTEHVDDDINIHGLSHESYIQLQKQKQAIKEREKRLKEREKQIQERENNVQKRELNVFRMEDNNRQLQSENEDLYLSNQQLKRDYNKNVQANDYVLDEYEKNIKRLNCLKNDYRNYQDMINGRLTCTPEQEDQIVQQMHDNVHNCDLGQELIDKAVIRSQQQVRPQKRSKRHSKRHDNDLEL